MRSTAADQAGNDRLEGGIRGKLLGFGDVAVYNQWTAIDAAANLCSVVVRRLFRNASLVGYPRFFVSQARVFVVLGVCPGTCVVPLRAAVGPFVRDCEAERLFLYCVVRSKFDSFEMCPGVGTVVTAVVACGVPEWWHSFGYG
ncbi:hypothetical protein Taro_022390 [Colocasia esculenta]|uniref:Uncharacterized protein n=1 Tax=Colocasia esculenta TaxID=4460 RepID=A0A843V198_COLES|nr:hypothetical protein [Colocasia esculenta]